MRGRRVYAANRLSLKDDKPIDVQNEYDEPVSQQRTRDNVANEDEEPREREVRMANRYSNGID